MDENTDSACPESNEHPAVNYPAHRLYANRTYTRLVEHLGIQSVYVLSAGWGLIAADFLTPYYDITFSPSAAPHKRRRKADRYLDFGMLPAGTRDQIVFFGGKDYLPLFAALTAGIETRKIVFYNSVVPPAAPGCVLQRFHTTTKTNWHYECANAVMAGAVTLTR